MVVIILLWLYVVKIVFIVHSTYCKVCPVYVCMWLLYVATLLGYCCTGLYVYCQPSAEVEIACPLIRLVL